MTVADPLLACIQGRISPAVAIARLLLAGEDAAEIRRHLDGIRGQSAAWAELDRLARDAPRLQVLRGMLESAGVDHAKAASPAAIAALFDRAVAASPEASVAMYSLGDGHRLQKATDELVRWLCERQLLAPALEVLDLGCGIGRIAAAVAPSVRWVLGSEISAGMIKQAQARCARVSNISFVMTSGRDLATLANAVFDLVLAVDSFPYLMQAGVAVCHMAEAWRVLRPAGRLVVLNLSYRGCPEADDDDARAWAQRFGFRVLHAETTPFSHWDGSAYVFQRA